ncbi:MAG: hypothetical protein ULS35scaffold63_54 [Phage 33_17]|nr:MAG: hypothetical protein ULS35scaffold63_54 [Phage 33_17]
MKILNYMTNFEEIEMAFDERLDWAVEIICGIRYD